MHTKTIKELSVMLQSRQVSATELAQHFLARIAQSDLNAFLHVDEPLTLGQAADADTRIQFNDVTPLTGIPIAHKDIFVTRDWRSTAGSTNRATARWTASTDRHGISRCSRSPTAAPA